MNRLLILLLLLGSFNAMAKTEKNEKGNGGDGVVVGDRVYLFDLYESGIQDVYLSEEVSKRVDVTTKVNQSLSAFSPSVRNIVANKIVALRAVDIALAEVLLKGFNMFSWRILPFSLQDVADDDGTDIEFSTEDLVQVAVRNNRVIRIDKNLMSKMDDGQVAALIFHEIIYSFIKPSNVVGSDGKTTYKQSSRWVRDINSYLFSHEFKVNPRTLKTIIGDRLPLSSKLSIDQAKYFIYDETGFATDPQAYIGIINSSSFDKINYETWSAKNGELEKILNSICKGNKTVEMESYSQNVIIEFTTLNDNISSEKTYLSTRSFSIRYKKPLFFHQDNFENKGGDLRVNLKACVQGISTELNVFFQRYSINK